jgi:hypothetical protein
LPTVQPIARPFPPDADYGDMAVSGGGSVWVIDAGAVSNSKLAQAPANTIRANLTGATAPVADVSLQSLATALAGSAVVTTSLWFDGQAANPGAAQVIADSGPLTAALGTVRVQIVVNADVLALFTIEYRNAANSVTLHKQDISVIANTAVTIGPVAFTFADGERVRILNKTAIALGNVSASIFVG